MDGLEACPKGEVPVARCSVGADLIESEFDLPCKSDRLRAAHPCALSRSTAHPVHNPTPDELCKSEKMDPGSSPG